MIFFDLTMDCPCFILSFFILSMQSPTQKDKLMSPLPPAQIIQLHPLGWTVPVTYGKRSDSAGSII